jgi:hypothetical protein
MVDGYEYYGCTIKQVKKNDSYVGSNILVIQLISKNKDNSYGNEYIKYEFNMDTKKLSKQ